jgi:transcriptional regulator with XRE-family HTH domain
MNAMQCRMARAALQMSVRDLAEAAKVATGTVVRMEAGEELKERTVEAMQRAFEERGVEFINGDAPGLRVHSKSKVKTNLKKPR